MNQYKRIGIDTSKAVFTHGCSTLSDDEFEKAVDSSESGAVAVLAEGTGAVGLEDVEGEAAQASEYAGVGSDARAIFAHGDIAAVM